MATFCLGQPFYFQILNLFISFSDSDLEFDVDKEQRNANHRGGEAGNGASVSTGSAINRADNHCIITTTAKINMENNYSFMTNVIQ